MRKLLASSKRPSRAFVRFYNPGVGIARKNKMDEQYTDHQIPDYQFGWVILTISHKVQAARYP